jgi:hypothetical protein
VGGGFPTLKRGSGGKVPREDWRFSVGPDAYPRQVKSSSVRALCWLFDKTVTVEPVGEFELKGIRHPVAAYNVLASSSSKPN